MRQDDYPTTSTGATITSGAGRRPLSGPDDSTIAPDHGTIAPDLHRLIAELEAARKRLADLVDDSPHATIVHSDGIVRFANRAAARMVGLRDPTQGVGKRLLDWIHPSSRAEVIARHMDGFHGDFEGVVNETVLNKVDGSTVVVETVRRRTEWDGRPAIHVVMWDVDRRHRREGELAWSATHDPLTALANRRALRVHLDTLATTGRQLAVFFVDLDDFKAINDRLGHAAGDELLRLVARRLAGSVKEGDMVARVGGDEFVVVVDGIGDQSRAERIAGRLGTLMDEPFTVSDEAVLVGATVGFALTSASQAVEHALCQADLAMLEAKARRRPTRLLGSSISPS